MIWKVFLTKYIQEKKIAREMVPANIHRMASTTSNNACKSSKLHYREKMEASACACVCV